jgi:hypothetical protein
MNEPAFKDNILHFQYGGATVQISRYPGPDAWGWDWQHFIAINGDHSPYGVPYRYYGTAANVAKRRIDKGDFEPSEYFLKWGSFSLDYPFKRLKGFEPPTAQEAIDEINRNLAKGIITEDEARQRISKC